MLCSKDMSLERRITKDSIRLALAEVRNDLKTKAFVYQGFGFILYKVTKRVTAKNKEPKAIETKAKKAKAKDQSKRPKLKPMAKYLGCRVSGRLGLLRFGKPLV